MKKLYRGLSFLTAIAVLGGCAPSVRGKQEIPKPVCTEAGFAVKSELLNDGTVSLTYALVGLNEDKIRYLYLDQIESKPSEDRSLFTNREMQNAYGLGYEDAHGEWHQQIEALENYITGHQMTLEEVHEIKTESVDEAHPMVPAAGTDLEAGCDLDLTKFMAVIDEACENAEPAETSRLGVGEDIRIYKRDNSLQVVLAAIGTDYRYKISYAKLDAYKIDANSETTLQSLRTAQPDIRNFEDYIKGLNCVEAYSVETYDPGNGIETALPKPGTDLADVCSMDLDKYLLAINEAAKRLK